MENFKIPIDLIEMITERKVIPFIGAGFSSSLDLPNWDTLLKNISKEIDGALPYEEVAEHCKNNPLEIAEYYFIKANNNIGPIRYAISNSFNNNHDPIFSGPHVELVNLGAQQIYTTNYDDLIETTYKVLNVPSKVICLAKDVAASTDNKTQIIKYHGDLRYENTLVLTESSYFSRMDFDSPMDIKFRADLLGKSVLFMGYSFRDINIRIIWFKLMKMMKDISIDNRPNSYIVRFDPNPVLEELYEAVGIKTIILDPKKSHKEKDYNKLFSKFMLHLSQLPGNNDKIPGTDQTQFISMALLGLCKDSLLKVENKKPIMNKKIKRLKEIEFRRTSGELLIYLDLLCRREPTKELLGQLNAISNILSLAGQDFIHRYNVKIALNILDKFGYTETVSYAIISGLVDIESRKVIFDANIEWKNIWDVEITEEHAKRFLKLLEGEIKQQHAGLGFLGDSETLAHLIDLAIRIKNSKLIKDSEKDLIKFAQNLIQQSKELFPSVSKYKPSKSKPELQEIIKEIETKNNAEEFF